MQISFIATLGITNRCIRTVVVKNKNGVLDDDLRGKHGNIKQVPQEIKNDIRAHIKKIPVIEIH